MPHYKSKLSSPKQQQALQDRLKALNDIYHWRLCPEQYCAYRLDGHLAPSEWLRVKQYSNGTLLIDAANEALLTDLLNAIDLYKAASALGTSPENALSTPSAPQFAYPYAGSDESGKGDYFGPLVVAAVALQNEAQAAQLKALGINDSKTLTDTRIARLMPELTRILGPTQYHISCLMPDSYNAHYVRQGSNLNTLLTKTHLHSLTQLKRQWQCDAAQSAPLHCVVIDQFGSDAKIRQHCQGLDLPIILSPRAESQYMAVAAASCMARQTFVTRMQQLGEQWGMVLPLGAGPQVKRAKQVFVGQHGQDALPHVAKMHFKV